MFKLEDNIKFVNVDINYSKSDSEDEKKYKDLLNKEYSFCVKIANELISKASKIYDK